MNIHDILVDKAFLAAKRSTCSRHAVGCVIVDEASVDNTSIPAIISSGFNHAPYARQCIDLVLSDELTHEGHRQWSKMYEIHAEADAIKTLPDNYNNLTLVCTHLPCSQCAQHIVNTKRINRVIYSIHWDNEGIHGKDILTNNNIEVVQHKENKMSYALINRSNATEAFEDGKVITLVPAGVSPHSSYARITNKSLAESLSDGINNYRKTMMDGKVAKGKRVNTYIGSM